MSLIRTVLDRARARRAGGRTLPGAMPPDARRAALAALVEGTLVPREVILSGPAGRIVLTAADRRLHRAVIAPQTGGERRFGPPDGAFDAGFDAALDAVLGAGALAVAFGPAAGDSLCGTGEPADRLRQAAPDLAPAEPTGPVPRFLAALSPVAADAAVLPVRDLPAGLGAVLDRLAGGAGAPVLVLLVDAARPEEAQALVRAGTAAGLGTLPRSRLGLALRGWDAAQDPP